MSSEARGEILEAIRDRYRVTQKYHRKHAIRLLRKRPKDEKEPRVSGKKVYDEAVKEALILIWETADRICGKRLKAVIPNLVSAMERHGHLQLEVKLRRKVLAVSAATIDVFGSGNPMMMRFFLDAGKQERTQSQTNRLLVRSEMPENRPKHAVSF